MGRAGEPWFPAIGSPQLASYKGGVVQGNLGSPQLVPRNWFPAMRIILLKKTYKNYNEL